MVGSFDNLWDATPLDPVLFDGQPTLYRAATVLVPKGQIHTYKFLVDGQPTLDPINPQRIVLDNGIEWSRFFTQQCANPVSFEAWELVILTRLTNEILPFTSVDAQRFMDLYYFTADKGARARPYSTRHSASNSRSARSISSTRWWRARSGTGWRLQDLSEVDR